MLMLCEMTVQHTCYVCNPTVHVLTETILFMFADLKTNE